MRISYLASAALAVCILPLAGTAYAGSSHQTITYGSGSYGDSQSMSSTTLHNSGSHSSHSHSSMSTRYGGSSGAPCPSGSTRSGDGVCLTSGTTSVGRSYTSSSSTIVPFTTTVDNISSYRIEGMGANEFLSETSCPTSVYNPEGAKVLGCYSVVKKAAPAPVYRPAPVVVPQVRYQQVRVVRPIIYVRYPVPTPYAVPVYQPQYRVGGCGMAYSRYGNNWPRMGGGCGGW